MNDAVLKIGSVSIYGFGVLAVISFLWGSFVFYKKSVESHFNERVVLDAIVLSAFWALILGRVTFGLLNIMIFWNHFSRLFLLTDYPGINSWGVICGISFGVFLSIRKFKGKFFDWFDFVSLGVTSGMAVFYCGMAFFRGSLTNIVISLFTLAAFVLFWGVEDNYRTFSWYRNKKTSAKSGFIGGFLISLWGILSIVEMLLLTKLSLFAVIWGMLLFVGGLVMVYIRSGRTVGEDIKIIFKNGKK